MNVERVTARACCRSSQVLCTGRSEGAGRERSAPHHDLLDLDPRTLEIPEGTDLAVTADLEDLPVLRRLHEDGLGDTMSIPLDQEAVDIFGPLATVLGDDPVTAPLLLGDDDVPRLGHRELLERHVHLLGTWAMTRNSIHETQTNVNNFSASSNIFKKYLYCSHAANIHYPARNPGRDSAWRHPWPFFCIWVAPFVNTTPNKPVVSPKHRMVWYFVDGLDWDTNTRNITCLFVHYLSPQNRRDSFFQAKQIHGRAGTCRTFVSHRSAVSENRQFFYWRRALHWRNRGTHFVHHISYPELEIDSGTACRNTDHHRKSFFSHYGNHDIFFLTRLYFVEKLAVLVSYICHCLAHCSEPRRFKGHVARIFLVHAHPDYSEHLCPGRAA